MLRRAFRVFTLAAGVGWMIVQTARATSIPRLPEGEWVLSFESVSHNEWFDEAEEAAEADLWKARGTMRFDTVSDEIVLRWDDGTFAVTK